MPLAPLLWVFFQMLLSFELCSGSMGLDLVPMSRVLQLLLIWGVDVVSFGCQNVSFCMLLASIWQGHSEAQEGRPWGPGSDFWRFGVDVGTAFWFFWQTLQQHMCFVVLVSRARFSMISGSEFRMLGL